MAITETDVIKALVTSTTFDEVKTGIVSQTSSFKERLNQVYQLSFRSKLFQTLWEQWIVYTNQLRIQLKNS